MSSPVLTAHQRKRLIKRYVTKALRLWVPDAVTVEITLRCEEDAYGSSHVLPEYRRTRLNVNLERCQTKEDIARTVAHEIMHILTAPLFDLAMDMARESDNKALIAATTRANEQVVSSLEETHWEALVE